ncbi:MAG: methyl-accepting chemotaxis protein [Hyphomonadaceae bacterium]
MLNWVHQRMSVGARLGLIAALMMAPILMLGGLFVQQCLSDIDFAKREMSGADYIQAMWEAFDQAGQPATSEMEAARAQFDPMFNTGAASTAFLSANEPQAHRDAGRAFFVAVADASNLTLDPDLDSFYVMDLVVQRLPQMHDSISALAEAVANPADVGARAVALDHLQTARLSLESSVRAAIAGNPDGGTAEALRDRAAAVSQVVDELVSKAQRGEPIEEQAFDQAANDLWNASALELDRLIQDRINSLQNNFLMWTGASAAVLALAMVLIFLISGAMSRRISALVDAMQKLAADNSTVTIPCQEDTNETGKIAASLNSFKASLIERLRLQAEALVTHEQTEEKLRDMEAKHAAATKELAYVVAYVKEGLTKLYEGDLTYRLKELFPVDYKSIRMDFNQAAKRLEETMQGIHHAANSMRATAKDLSASADSLSHRTEQQAAGLEETAAALEQISSTVHSNASHAKRVREMATATGEEAAAGSVVLNETRDAMSKIERSSNEVGRILGVIDEIAFQTNLLALNAGVEAARAGDAGRGFAVVATEVRALAQRSSEAAKDIKELINSSSTDVETGVELVAKTAAALERIVTRVAEINSLVGTVAAAAEEEARGVAEVNTAVTQMDQITQQNAAMVEESTAASHALAEEASGLAAMVEQFKISSAAAAAAPTQLRRAS